MPEKGRGLEERTALFAARIVNVCEAIPPGRLKSGHLKDQLFRAGTSVAANYAKAEEPESREDFVHAGAGLHPCFRFADGLPAGGYDR